MRRMALPVLLALSAPAPLPRQPGGERGGEEETEGWAPDEGEGAWAPDEGDFETVGAGAGI